MPSVDVPGLPPNNPTYSQAFRLGELIFVSGQLGVDPHSRQLVEGGIQAQTQRAIDHLETILVAAGSSLAQVAKVNIYIADFAWLPAMNEVYARRFPPRPAKTTGEVSRLDKDALIEIEVVAQARPLALP